jgi:uncharacterized protein YkwD
MPEEVLFEGLSAAGAEFGVPSLFGATEVAAPVAAATLAEGVAPTLAEGATTAPVTGAGPIAESTLPPLEGAIPAASTAATTVDLSNLGGAPALPTGELPTVDVPVESTATAPQVSQPTVSDVQGDFSTTTTEPTGKLTQGPDTSPVDLEYQNVPPTTTGGQNAITKALQSLGITSPTGGLGPNAFQAAGLGANVLSQLAANKQRQSLQQQLQKQSDITAPAAKQLMTQFQSGTIGAAQEKQITDYINNQRAQIKQRYARMGRDPNLDSAAQQEMANVDVQAAAMRDAALQNVLSSGLKAAGVSAGPAQQAILAGYNQDQSAQKTQADFLKALADMQARAGTGTQTTPTAPAAV